MDTMEALFLKVLIPGALTILGLAVPALAAWVAKKIIAYVENRLDIDLSDQTEAYIEQVVFRGIKAVEELARAEAKKKGAATPGDDKLSLALAKIKSELSAAGIDINANEVTDRIHDALDTLRNERAGSTSTVGGSE